jgi:hypothetical protein|tara:strand:+ start:95 stop:484 length:390 start_codon:yes stop_codon:yes gene_type:complete
MKIILGLLLLLGTVAFAEPPNFDQYAYRNPPPQQQQRQPPQQEHTLNTLPDDAVSMLLEQGVLGLVVLALGFWFVKESKINRIDRNAQLEKYVILAAEISSHLAQNSTRLENLEREIEQAKQIEMLKRS